MSRTASPEEGEIVRGFLSFDDLLEETQLARIYTYVYREGGVTIGEPIGSPPETGDRYLLLAFRVSLSMSLLTSLLIGAANELIYLVPLTLIIGWLLGYQVDAFRIFTTMVVAIAVSYSFGLFYAHPAPYQIQQTIVSDTPVNSFPSQHTTVLFAFAFAALWQKHYAVGTAFMALGVIVGIARVAVGYHWPIDIIGALAATIVAIAFVAAIEAYVEQLAKIVIEIEYRVRSAVGLE